MAEADALADGWRKRMLWRTLGGWKKVGADGEEAQNFKDSMLPSWSALDTLACTSALHSLPDWVSQSSSKCGIAVIVGSRGWHSSCGVVERVAIRVVIARQVRMSRIVVAPVGRHAIRVVVARGPTP